MFILLSSYRKPTRLGPDFLIGPILDVLVDDAPKCSNSMEQAERGKCSNSPCYQDLSVLLLRLSYSRSRFLNFESCI
jgi:hypothetical protein